MRIALDTNILGYAAGLIRSSADPAKVDRARTMLDRLVERHEIVVAAQVLGELYNIMVKSGLPRSDARVVVDLAAEKYAIAVSDREAFAAAFTLATEHHLQIWDALILATSAAARCELLLTEDMQDGLKSTVSP